MVSDGGGGTGEGTSACVRSYVCVCVCVCVCGGGYVCVHMCRACVYACMRVCLDCAGERSATGGGGGGVRGGGGAGDVLKQSHNTANTTTFQIHEKEAQTIRTENHCSQTVSIAPCERLAAR